MRWVNKYISVPASVLILLVALSLEGCVEDVDFNQADEFEVKPVLTGSIMYFELSSSVMSLADQPIDVSDTTEMRVFRDFSFIEENAYKAEIQLEIENSIAKPFEVYITLIDDAGTNHEFLEENPILISASNGVNASLTKRVRVYEGVELSELLNTTKFAIRFVGMSEIQPTDTGYLKLRSSGTVYLLL